MRRLISLAFIVSLSGVLIFAGPAQADYSIQTLGKRVTQKAASAWKALRKKTDQLTDKFVGKMSKPLDRSSANKKEATLNAALNEANKASAAASAKAKTANQEIYKLRNEGFGSSASSSTSSSSKKEGRFTSLD